MEPRQRSVNGQDVKIVVVFLVASVIILSAMGFLAWSLMLRVEPNVARAWALITTVLLPIVGFAGYRLGKTEERGTLKGLEVGVSRVIDAANRTADVKATATRRMRQAQAEPPSVVVLPPPEPSFSIRPQLTAGEVIELE
jgi:hypothetical protein